MNLGKYIFGIREENFHQSERSERDEQFLSYNLLAAMFFVLVALSVIAGSCYGLMIFQSWWAAFFAALLLGGISFILLLLVLFLNLTTRYKALYEKMTNMELVYDSHKGQDYSSISDERAQAIVQEYKMRLREENYTPDDPSFHFSAIFTSTIKVILVFIISIIVANGMEMLIFRQKVNESLSSISQSPLLLKAAADTSSSNADPFSDDFSKVAFARWTKDMLKEREETPFLMIDSYSFLLSFETLQRALGKWKIIFDLLFAILFLVPYLLVRKSKRYAGGAYLKEQALSDITTSFLFYILTQRKTKQIQKAFEEEYDYERFIKN